MNRVSSHGCDHVEAIWVLCACCIPKLVTIYQTPPTSAISGGLTYSHRSRDFLCQGTGLGSRIKKAKNSESDFEKTSEQTKTDWC